MVSFPPPKFSTTCSGAAVLLAPRKLIVTCSGELLEPFAAGMFSVIWSPPALLSLTLIVIPWAVPLVEEPELESVVGVELVELDPLDS
jgi:hypothetical protein